MTSTTSTTRKALYTALLAAFENGSLSVDGIDSERAVELLTKDIANLSKPKVSKKDAEKRALVDDDVLNVLENHAGASLTATEILSESAAVTSVQSVVASLKRLVAEGKALRMKEGKTTYFRLA